MAKTGNIVSLKTKNALVAGFLTAFVGGAYFYTMRAVGGQDDIAEAIKKLKKDSLAENKN